MYVILQAIAMKLPKILKRKESYEIELSINGFTFNIKTDDLYNGILSLEPEDILTESYFTITKGESMFQKKLTLVQTRKLFRDETSLEMFINNLQLD